MDSEKMKSVIVVVVTVLTIIVIESMGSMEKVADDYQKLAMDAFGNSVANRAQKTTTKKSSKPSCSKKGHKLHGKVQFVDSFPDLTIEYVSSFSDIDVQFVSSFPSDCGQWQIVESFPDFTVQEVSSFADLKVKKVSSFPGMNE